MASPRSAEIDVRAEIVRAATRLFAAKGFDATALQEIADAVGVTKPAVLHHFPSKEHVRQGVLAEFLEHWQATLPRLLLAASAGRGRFDAVFGELYRFFSADTDRARLVLREALDRPEDVRRLIIGPVRPWLDAVAGYVRAGQVGGRHHDDVDPEAYVIQILSMVISLSANRALNASYLDDDVARYDREIARMARAGLFSGRPRLTEPPPAPSDFPPPPPPAPKRRKAKK